MIIFYLYIIYTEINYIYYVQRERERELSGIYMYILNEKLVSLSNHSAANIYTCYTHIHNVFHLTKRGELDGTVRTRDGRRRAESEQEGSRLQLRRLGMARGLQGEGTRRGIPWG